MEYVPSIKINDIATLRRRGCDTRAIADTLVNVFLDMIITKGYVHCDPHPGNVGVMDDGATLVLYDFGNVIELSSDFRKEVNNLIFAVYQKDVDEFVDILLKLHVFKLANGADSLDIRLFFRSFFDYLETLDIKTLQSSIRNQELFSANTDISKLKVDPDFLALFRVFSLLDGTCSQLDPEFNYIDSLAPFTQDLFSDMTFFDYRIKTDLAKVQRYPKLILSTEQSVARMQKQFNASMDNMRKMQYILIACIVATSYGHADLGFVILAATLISGFSTL
jgi:predicted unusual protein kinase regulating ubiquinone biosynthesis (AarF/ABC1/UbiB family)